MTEAENIQKISIAEPIQLNINIPDIGKVGKDGTNGKDGRDGDSAYKIAVKNGFVGTEKEWLSSLKGGGSNESTNVTLSQLVVDDLLRPNDNNYETFADLLRKGVRLEKLYSNTSDPDTSNEGVVWSLEGIVYDNDEINTFLLLDEMPHYLAVKRASDNKTFLVPVAKRNIKERPWTEYSEISLEDQSVIRITGGKCRIRYKQNDDDEIDVIEAGYGFKSYTDGYEVVDAFIKTDSLTHSKQEFQCNSSNVGKEIWKLNRGASLGFILTEVVITYKTQDGTKFNKIVYGFELKDESVVVALDAIDVKLEFRDFGESLYLHSVGSNDAIITGIYYK